MPQPLKSRLPIGDRWKPHCKLLEKDEIPGWFAEQSTSLLRSLHHPRRPKRLLSESGSGLVHAQDKRFRFSVSWEMGMISWVEAKGQMHERRNERHNSVSLARERPQRTRDVFPRPCIRGKISKHTGAFIKTKSCSSLPQTAPVHACFPSLIINSAPFHSQKIYALDVKLYGHCTLKSPLPNCLEWLFITFRTKSKHLTHPSRPGLIWFKMTSLDMPIITAGIFSLHSCPSFQIS